MKKIKKIDNGLWNIKEVSAYLDIKPGTIRKKIERGNFPPPIRLGPQIHRWERSMVKKWLKAKIKASR